MNGETDATLKAIAQRLTAQAGRALPLRLTRLPGGRNNRVYRLDTDEGEPLVIKRYFQDPRDSRDRLGAEWSFITHAWSRGLRSVPEPLACDPAEQAAFPCQLRAGTQAHCCRAKARLCRCGARFRARRQ